MAYITTEFTKKIRKQLKEAFPTIKFSVTLRHHSSLCVAIMSSSEFDFGTDCADDTFNNHRGVNYYHIENNYKNEAILQKIVDVCMADHWDKSDLMTDYHNCAYYFELSIGKWNKPFIYTGEPTPEPEVEAVEEVQTAEEVHTVEAKEIEVESILVEWSESNLFEDGTYYEFEEYETRAFIASRGVESGYYKTKLHIKCTGHDEAFIIRHDINENNPSLRDDLYSRDRHIVVDCTRADQVKAANSKHLLKSKIIISGAFCANDEAIN